MITSFKKIEKNEMKKIKGGDGVYRCIPGEECVDQPPPPPTPCPPNTLIIIDGVRICPQS